MRRPTRREFLKLSAAGTAPSAAAAGPKRPRAGKQEIKIGMLGCGGRCSGPVPRPGAGQGRQARRPMRRVRRPDASQADLVQGDLPQPVPRHRRHLHLRPGGVKAVIAASDAVLIACASKYHPFYAERRSRPASTSSSRSPTPSTRPAAIGSAAPASWPRRRTWLHLRPREPLLAGVPGAVKQIHAGRSAGSWPSSRCSSARLRRGAPRQGLNEVQYQFANWYHFRWLLATT